MMWTVELSLAFDLPPALYYSVYVSSCWETFDGHADGSAR